MDPIDQPITNIVDFKTASYFPLTWRLAGIMFTLGGMSLWPLNIYVGTGIMILGVLVVTTHYRIAIDFNRHTYHEYTWILGIRSGERGHFDEIEYIYINKNKVSQTYSSRVSSSTLTSYDYNGYLKFSSTQKLHLRSDSDKNTILRHMQVIAAKLNCQLQDYSND